MISCSSVSQLSLQNEVGALYGGKAPINCKSSQNKKITKMEMSHCLGLIYIQESRQDIPKVSSSLFVDIEQGDPRLPFVLVSIYRGLVQPTNLTKFGGQELVTTEDWYSSVKKLKDSLKKHKKNVNSIRLR